MTATMSGLMNGPMKFDVTVLKSVVAGLPCEFRVNITLGAMGGAVLPTIQNLEPRVCKYSYNNRTRLRDQPNQNSRVQSRYQREEVRDD